ncbi:MAG: hypothetical protein HC902_05870 [Calothrix sp. SM1_5_4]|nr:hypothetical protein [Calothrix sp. SM1_5_4]
MRSTSFIVFSILLHGLAITMIAISPQRIAEPTSELQGAEFEVRGGEPADQPGVAQAPPAEKALAPKPAKKATQPAEPRRQTVVAVAPKATMPATTSPAATAQSDAAKDDAEENPLDPEVEGDIPVIPAMASAAQPPEPVPETDAGQ